MSDGGKRYAGGCLCGALRYEADGEPLSGYCYCNDCRKASGSGRIPFMGFSKAAVRYTGETRKFASKAARGGDAVRNSCPICDLVFGGEIGKHFTIYAGSLDDPLSFSPRSRSSPAIARPGLLFRLTWWSSTRCRPRGGGIQTRELFRSQAAEIYVGQEHHRDKFRRNLGSGAARVAAAHEFPLAAH
jgi:hypothetical protein